MILSDGCYILRKPSLFDNRLRKVELIHHIVKLVPTCIVPATLDMELQCVLDGGGMLYKFAWPKHSSYAEER